MEGNRKYLKGYQLAREIIGGGEYWREGCNWGEGNN